MKKILFFFNSYHEYWKKIETSLITLSYEVTLFPITKEIDLFTDFLMHIKKDYFVQKSLKEQNDFYLTNINNKKYDYLFVLNGQILNFDVYKKIRLNNSQAISILYLWDDIVRLPELHKNLELFDSIFSFDLSDCRKYGFKPLPLFYVNDFEIKNNLEKIYDIEYLGVLHSSRYELLKKIDSFSKLNHLNFDANIVCGYLAYMKKRFISKEDYRYSKYLRIKSLCISDCANLLKKSHSIIDMPLPTQNGLPMRCLESLPAQCKIITTNEYIKEYDFYCPENVMIIDRENPVFDVDFIRSPYKPIPKEIVEKYSLENWIKTIFRE